MKSKFFSFFLGIFAITLGALPVLAQNQISNSVENAIYYGEQSNEDQNYDHVCYKTNSDDLSKLRNDFVVVGKATGGVSRVYENDKKEKLVSTYITAEPEETSVAVLTNMGSRYQLTSEIGMRIDASDNSITLIEIDSEKGCAAAAWLTNSELAKTSGLLHPGSVATFAGLAAILRSIKDDDEKEQLNDSLPPVVPPAPASPN